MRANIGALYRKFQKQSIGYCSERAPYLPPRRAAAPPAAPAFQEEILHARRWRNAARLQDRRREAQASTATRKTARAPSRPLTKDSFPGKWKVIFFYPKDFTFVCPTEIAEFARLNQDFDDRDTVVLGGSTDNEHSKLGWRREHPDLQQPADLALRRQRRQVRPRPRRAGRGRRRRPARHLRRRPAQRRAARLRHQPERRPRPGTTPCGCSTPCRPTSSAPATARWAATTLKAA